MNAKLALFCCSSLVAAGCAGFKANSIPVVDRAELVSAPAQKSRVFSRWSVESPSRTVNDKVKVAGGAISKKYFDDEINASGCCVLVEGPTDADVVVDGTAIDDNNRAALIPAVITGLSLYTIPSWINAKTHIKAGVKASGQEHTYEFSDSMTVVQWLPMLFVMPFKGNPISSAGDVDQNAYRNLILRMKKDGVLK